MVDAKGNSAAPARAPGRGKYDRTLSKGERRDAQRSLLLEATGVVLAERGYAGATVRKVCEQAGMSRRTFYEHFKDLRTAVAELHAFATDYAFEFVEERVAKAEDPVEGLTCGVRAFFSLIAEHGPLAQVIFREVRGAGPEYEARRMQAIERFVELVVGGVNAAFEAKVISRSADRVTIFALVSALEAVAMRYVLRGEAERVTEAEASMVELVFRAFA